MPFLGCYGWSRGMVRGGFFGFFLYFYIREFTPFTVKEFVGLGCGVVFRVDYGFIGWLSFFFCNWLIFKIWLFDWFGTMAVTWATGVVIFRGNFVGSVMGLLVVIFGYGCGVVSFVNERSVFVDWLFWLFFLGIFGWFDFHHYYRSVHR